MVTVLQNIKSFEETLNHIELHIFGSTSNGVGFVALYRERRQEPGTYQVLD